jgi:hypothetical protein
VIAPFIISFMLPVPEASLPAVDICSDKSAPGRIFSQARQDFSLLKSDGPHFSFREKSWRAYQLVTQT